MILCSFLEDGNPHVGVKTDNGIVSLTAIGFPSRLNEIIGYGVDIQKRIAHSLDSVTNTTHGERAVPIEHATYNEESIEFLPVSDPGKILCVGLNYKDHAEETGSAIPEHPVFFSKYNDAPSAHNQPVILPPWFDHYDYEAELVIVVGRYSYNISVDEADEYIFGYTCGNDLSERKNQGLSSQWLCGKALPGFGPVGPYIVTRDSFDPGKDNVIRCEVNGVTVQSSVTSNMIFSCREIMSAASRFFPLSPGDLIFTGTPGGVIVGRKKEERVWLKPGDTVKVSIDGIGTLTTPLV